MEITTQVQYLGFVELRTKKGSIMRKVNLYVRDLGACIPFFLFDNEFGVLNDFNNGSDCGCSATATFLVQWQDRTQRWSLRLAKLEL